MKRIILILSILLLTVCSSVSSVFADAADYDIQNAGYYVYVATPDGGLNMRYGPGTEYDKVTENRIPDGVRLYIELTSGHWGYTSYNGNNGWVTLRQTTTTPPAPPATVKPTPIPTPVPTPVPNPATAEPQTTPAPQITTEPANTPSPSATSETEQPETDEQEVVKSALESQILLVAILVLFIVIIALLIVIIINLKSKK